VTGTTRARAKAHRRDALVTAATRLFAERGFDRVSIEELGAAAGVSGPAMYRHFASKQVVLAAILVEVSEWLLERGTAIVDEQPDAAVALDRLIGFHVDFALASRDVIRIQDHDLDKLAANDEAAVRSAQRSYVELWVGVLAHLRPDDTDVALRLRAHATFGLINSTPHSAGRAEHARDVLESMARAALLS
jgi:AcrR family transcriptional regulator